MQNNAQNLTTVDMYASYQTWAKRYASSKYDKIYTHSKEYMQNNMQSQTKTRLTFTTGKNHMENNMQVQMLPYAYSSET